MTNSEKFKQLFGIYATELWAMPEEKFLEWLNAEALEQQERDSNKRCETCKYKNLPVSENPCDECYFASDYEDYYEAEEDNE